MIAQNQEERDMSRRWKLVGAGVVVYAAVVWFFGMEIRPPVVVGAQKDKAKDKEKKADTGTKAKPIYYGIKSCTDAGCHSAPEDKPFVQDPPLVCRNNEGTLWKKYDKHGLAYLAIDTEDAKNTLAERARQMEKILAAGKGDKNYKVYKDPDCLACHALVVKPKVEKADDFNIKEGVNCVVCHGAYQEWVVEHSAPLLRKKYRALSREAKWHDKGMVDLWNPVKRTELCASCHIGNKDEGKFVTHEMYAAGHPPLPSFEVASFSNEMPRHWQNVRWKPESIQKLQKLSTPSPDVEQARLVLLGSVVSLRSSLKLLEHQAKACLKAEDDDGKLLDLSNFDCYACHHDLKTPSWRQKRGYGGNKPGRIPMKTWPTELVRLAIKHLGSDKDDVAAFDKNLKAINLAFTSRPYGDAKKIEAAAKTFITFTDDLLKRLDKAKLDKAAVVKLLADAKTLYKTRDLDFDAARVVGWGYEAILNEANGYDSVEKKGKPEKGLKTVADYLKLRLPSGVVPRGSRETSLEKDLKENLEALNNYDSGKFKTLLRGLPGLLKSKD